MKYKAKNIRTFIGAKNYEESISFYRELGFEESIISNKMTLFKVNDELGFYLQDYYVKDWVNNSMIFLEVDNVDQYWEELNSKGLHNKYKYARLMPIKEFEWGRECFMHDPAGVLWHFCQFN
ncbi:MAG: glyoxalase [Flavobacteriales bacterium]|nr:MAG: glyoxalase [Flavobacteriales bacterium]